MENDALEALQNWYSAQCDGEWEHRYGITVGTLDNPGWTLRIDLAGTALEGRETPRDKTERSENDWFQVWSDGQSFDGAAETRTWQTSSAPSSPSPNPPS